MQKGRCVIVVLFVLAGIGLLFLRDSGSRKNRIGVVVPLVQSHSQYIIDGVKLAAEKYDFSVDLIDTKQDIEETLSGKNYIACIGPLFSETLLKIAPICSRLHIPLVSPSSTIPGISQIGEFCFSHSYTVDYEGKEAAEFFYKNFGSTAIVITQEDDDLSLQLAAAFTRRFQALGGVMRIVDESDVYGIYDCYLPVSAEYAEKFLMNAKTGIRYMGCSRWDGAKLDIFDNICYPAILSEKNPGIKEFYEQYEDEFSQTPHYLSLMAYESVQLIYEAAERAGYTPYGIQAGLYRTENFNAVSGSLTTLADGTIPCNFIWCGAVTDEIEKKN